MTIGIYGGSFDPIHTGHAMIANFIAQCGIVDEVWLMVSRKNPLKKMDAEASDSQRISMARMISRKCDKIKVCEIEMQLPYPSYTYVTLKALKNKFKDHTFKLIIGSDNFSHFNSWRNHEEIIREFGLIIYPRPGYPLNGDEPTNTIFLTGAPETSISSSLIREYVKSGWNINYFVPVEIADYIKEQNLYILN